jgi:hypothetical protein
MKNTMALIALLTIIGLGASAAEDKTGIKTFIPETFALDSSVALKTTNFDDSKGYWGTALSAYWTENIGLQLELWAQDTGGSSVDQSNVQLLFRNPVNDKFSYTLFLGGGREWQSNDYLVDAGVRVDQRLWKNVGAFGSARWEKLIDRDADHTAVFQAGLSLKF